MRRILAAMNWWSRLRMVLGSTLLLAASPPGGDVIGIPTTYVTRYEDTLLDIARQYDIGFIAIRAANPGVDPWLPGAGKTLAVPTRFILPDAPHRGIVINLPELQLYYFPTRGEPMSFPIGIGGEGVETPVGHTIVTRKREHPTWIPTASEHAEDPDLPAVVPPGPDNPMGELALYLGWKDYAIHGTNQPYSIGRRDSHGCIRMYPEDIARLFALVTPGTPVTVVDEPVKVGRQGSELYLEIHWDQADAELLETKGVPRAEIAADADGLVVKAAGTDVDRLNWYAIHLAEDRRDGIPVQATLPRSGF